MIDKIEKYDLCLGCGLCSSILGSEKCEMRLGDDGFYAPIVKTKLTKKEESIIKNVCPGIHVESNSSYKGAWGKLISVHEAWSSDSELRYKAASGGVVSSLAIYLLEKRLVDAILQVGVRDDSYLINEMKISRTKDDILSNAQSRYAPALIFDNVNSILEKNNDCYCFIGKPCDIAALKNFLKITPKYDGRVRYFISIFCAGIPSYKATEQSWKLSGHIDEPVSLKYRGDGWPGNFKAVFSDGSDFQLSYKDSWGKILGRQLGFRCKICPDGIGMLADIAVGDSWNTKDGYPDFSEAEGRSFCIVRSEIGSNLLHDAVSLGFLVSREMDASLIQQQQNYQYERRKLVGWRIVPVQLITSFLLHFKGLGLFRLALSANFRTGLKNMLGTYKRMKINGK